MKTVDGLHLAPNDSVVVLLGDAERGDSVRYGDGEVVALMAVPTGHKVAVAPVPAGGVVLKYGEPIGVATARIAPGEHVHVHNLQSARARGSAA